MIVVAKAHRQKPTVKDMWLTVAGIGLLAVIGFAALSLAVQWWDFTRKPDNWTNQR